MPLGHLGLNVRDLEASRQYYGQIMDLLGFESFLDHADEFAYRPVGGKPGTFLFFYPEQQGTADGYTHHSTGLQHLAFIVRTRGDVQAVRDKVAFARIGDRPRTPGLPAVPAALLRHLLARPLGLPARSRLPPRPGLTEALPFCSTRPANPGRSAVHGPAKPRCQYCRTVGCGQNGAAKYRLNRRLVGSRRWWVGRRRWTSRGLRAWRGRRR